MSRRLSDPSEQYCIADRHSPFQTLLREFELLVIQAGKDSIGRTQLGFTYPPEKQNGHLSHWRLQHRLGDDWIAS